MVTKPQNWGKDDVSKFIDIASDNGYITYQNFPDYYHKLVLIDSIYREINKYMANSKNIVTNLLFMKAHSAFLAGARLAVSCQVTECYPIIRTIIENSLYGLMINKDQEL
ncbi:MAG: hypothetical protein ABIH39_07070, partial [Candidatus Margulisiibacteriota bacterium]